MNIIPDRKDIERARSCTSDAKAKAQIEAITDPQKLMRRAIAFIQYSEYGQDINLWIDRARRIGMSDEELNQFKDILDSALNEDADIDEPELDSALIKEYSNFLFDMVIKVAKAWNKYSYSDFHSSPIGGGRSLTYYSPGTSGGSYIESSNKMYFFGDFYLYEPFFSKLVVKGKTEEENLMRVNCMEYAINHLDKKAIIDEINRQLQEVRKNSWIGEVRKRVNWNGSSMTQEVAVFEPRIRSGWNKFYKERVRQINSRLYDRSSNIWELQNKGMVFLEKGFDDYMNSVWDAFEEFKSEMLDD